MGYLQVKQAYAETVISCFIYSFIYLVLILPLPFPPFLPASLSFSYPVDSIYRSDFTIYLSTTSPFSCSRLSEVPDFLKECLRDRQDSCAFILCCLICSFDSFCFLFGLTAQRSMHNLIRESHFQEPATIECALIHIIKDL